MSNSWLVIRPSLKKLNDTVYLLCACGHTYTVKQTKMDYDEIYHCQSCKNSFFIPIKIFQNYMSSKQSFETLCYEIENDSTSKGDTYNAYIKIPYFTENSYTPIFQKKILLSVTLTHSLKAYESYCQQVGFINLLHDGNLVSLKEILQNRLYETITQHILQGLLFKSRPLLANQLKEIVISGQEKFKISQYFIEHPYYDNLELYFWDKNFLKNFGNTMGIKSHIDEILCKPSKAIKKNYFEQYKKIHILKSRILYDPSADYCFIRSFQDVNFIQSLVKTPYNIKQKCINVSNLKNVLNLIQNLKIFYSEKKIVSMFLALFASMPKSSLALNHYNDLLRVYAMHNASYILKNKKLSIFQLHDELVEIYNFMCSKDIECDFKITRFNYSQKQNEACVQHCVLTFKLPKTDFELQYWGKELHNCIGLYSQKIHHSTSLIYGVFIEEKLQYAINVSHNFSHVLEAKAKYNKVISTQHLKLIDEWLKIQQQNFNAYQ